MCGIAGEIRLSGQKIDQDRLRRMSEALSRRGPDGEGLWVEGQAGLAHRRLAIIDLTEGGKQPMSTPDGRYTITFNGEIYNYKELKEQITNSEYRFISESDTEVLLALYALEGEKMLEKIHGMFAFAIWDRDTSTLFFARDRIGKKPFFYRAASDAFTFASELKAIRAVDSLEIDELSVKLFLGLQYVPSPMTGFVGISSLAPGMCGTWREGQFALRKYVRDAGSSPDSFEKAAMHVKSLLDESVRLRLIADVPVGIFLSGGIDSSAIAALASKQGAKLSSFTLGFDDEKFDERDEAADLAKRFGFEHHSFVARPEDLLAIADDVIKHYDAPYADSSSLNTWLIAKETRKYAKAVLTGDGGDELFGGYRRYRYFEKALRFPRSTYQIARGIGKMTGNTKIQRFAETINGGYAALFCGAYFQQPEALTFIRERFNKEMDPIGAAMDFDLRSYLPDDLNVKMDRATMAHGLEARCPLLDQDLVAYVTSLPTSYRFSSTKQKALLVEAVKDLLPQDVLTRPKRGFQIPLAGWFRGPLRRAFVERCIGNKKLEQYISPSVIETLVRENDRGSDHGNRLWMTYSLATWLEVYG
ncbi:asparagine synthase (glutamine-hydrolyzing) [Candidatus Uhrbacteria bacterium]|nr:asparagine synthase (glutamine-hydrolyzing) [Candidatus Uhrbacteria bacterium]